MKRPIGIAVLAIVNAAEGLWGLSVGLGFLFAPHFTRAMLAWLQPPSERILTDYQNVQSSYLLLVISLALLWTLLALGLWRLKNWARVLFILISLTGLAVPSGGDSLSPLTNLVSDRLAPWLWPQSHFVTAGILGESVSWLVSILTLWYLLTPKVRQTFEANRAEWKWIVPFTALALIAFGYALSKSGPELHAMRWHARNGDRVAVNGVSFPVYYWHVPEIDPDGCGFSIADSDPGPLRPGERDPSFYLRVSGCRTDSESVTAEELLENKVAGFRRSGYTKLSKFTKQIAGQSMQCMSEDEFGNSRYCYGDGPLYSLFFAGGPPRSLQRFEDLVAGAQRIRQAGVAGITRAPD